MPEKRIHLDWNIPVTNDNRHHKAYVPWPTWAGDVGMIDRFIQTQPKQNKDIIRSPKHSPMFTILTIKGMCIVCLYIMLE